eukprot:GHVS01092733.1.p1 GENE.GHVS01092733.1~~GHVS01092733.1.p1  ORF type:complete len:209 (+),score=10.61 GHVS01092733.1:190-816(+)
MANIQDASQYVYTAPPQGWQPMNNSQNTGDQDASQYLYTVPPQGWPPMEASQNTGDQQASFFQGGSYTTGELGGGYGEAYPTGQPVDTASQSYTDSAYNYSTGQGYQDAGQLYPGYSYAGGTYPDMQAFGQSYDCYAGTTVGLTDTGAQTSDSGVRAVAEVLFGGSGAFRKIPLGRKGFVFRKRKAEDCTPAWSNAFATRQDPCDCRR